ncbi:MAG: carboxylate-amine ligase [Proteobacteria bacterium]|nr:carboxylate-amine ligase [Pseudomonadota bacterium]
MSNFRFGIEEEYFVTTLRTGNVRRTMSRMFFRSCQLELGGTVANELLQSQIEVITPPCTSLGEARAHLARYRGVLSQVAGRFGLGIMAAGTHPVAVWPEQRQTPKLRYDEVMADLQMLGRRNMVCGMHVHVEVPDPDSRIELIYRTVPFLPLLLALSASSPFWQGHQTGLLGYRLTAYDELPRTGLPEHFCSSIEYRRYVETLVTAGVIKDESFIWWAIRPSMRHPTIELRIADACTHMDDAICVAAIFRCLVRHLVHDTSLHAELAAVGRAIAEENKWRAQRYGTAAGFIDHVAMKVDPAREVLERLLELIRADAQALDCVPEIEHARAILARGSSAEQQIRVFDDALARGQARPHALKAVVDWLIAATAQV